MMSNITVPTIDTAVITDEVRMPRMVPMKSDPLLDMLFKPVRESLTKIRATTKSAIPDGQTRANELRVLLKQIGNFITDQLLSWIKIKNPSRSDSGKTC